MKHTKGEWKTEKVDGENKNIVIYTDEKPEGILNVYPCKEAKANAKLISAAPELLKTLKELMQASVKLAEEYEVEEIKPLWAIIADASDIICKAESD